MNSTHSSENKRKRPQPISHLKTKLIVVFTALMAFVSLGSWALASPVGASPDEDYHLVSIWCSWGERDELCAEGENPQERVVSERLVESSACFAQQPQKSAQCEIRDDVTTNTDRGNFSGNYPPVFYSITGLLASDNVTVSTIGIRLLNGFLFVGLLTLVLALVRPGQRGPILWSAAVALVPLGMFLIPSVNPSSWAILAGFVVWSSLYGFMTAKNLTSSISLATIALAAAIMGSGARGDAAVYVTISAVVALILSFQNSLSWLKKAIVPFGVVAVSFMFFLTTGQSQGAASVGASAGSTPGGAVIGGDVADAAAVSRLSNILPNLFDLPYLLTGGTGTWALGWLDTVMPPTVWVVMIGALSSLMFWGLKRFSRRKAMALLMILFALVAIPLYVLYGMGSRVGVDVQPRYTLPLLITFLGVLLVGFKTDSLGIKSAQAVLLFGAITVANSLALHNNIRRYVTGLGGGGSFNLNGNIEWWWNMQLQPMSVWLIGSLTFAATLSGIFWLTYSTPKKS